MELFRILGRISIDNSEANKALDETSAKAGEAGNETEGAFSKIGTAAVTVGKAVLTAGVALGTAWVAAIEGTREYRAEMAKLDTAFVTNGHSSEVAKQAYSDLHAVLGDPAQAVEAANHLALLTDNEKDLQTWTNICTGVYAQFGASLPIESLTESANEVARSGILTGGLVDSLVWAGISETEFQAKLDACSTEQERQNLIMETLNGTYSKASEQYKATNKDVMDAHRANEQLSDAFARLGAVGEPILTAIKEKVAEMVAAAVPMLESFIQKVKDLRKWVKDNQNTVDAWVAVIVGAGVAISSFLLVLKWGAILSSATKSVKGCRAAIVLFNAALRANPIGLVVSLLAGLVAAFIYLWNNNKGFRQFWINMWDKIKSVTGSAVKWVKGKFNDFKSAVGVVKTAFNNIKNAISDKLEEARNKVKSVIDKIKGFFPLKIGKIFSNLKIPKISVSGGKAPFGIAGKGKLPSFNVKWNAEGGIFKKPTVLPTLAGFQGFGEAGAEAITPIDTLRTYISEAVRAENEGIRATLIEQNRIMMDFLARIIPKGVMLDSGALVGELTPAIDMQLSDRLAHAQRGNTR